MAGVGRTTVSLRFSGRDLDPQQVEKSLGLTATKSYRKGEVAGWGRYKTTPAEEGFWSCRVEDREPGALDAQLLDLFGSATQDLTIWVDLSSRFRADLFCGLFMSESNEGLNLSAAVLEAITSRGLELGLDIYDPDRP